MIKFSENLFKRLMFLYRKDGNQAFKMASNYFAFFSGSLIILLIFFPMYLYLNLTYSFEGMDYIERKGRLLPIILPIYLFLIYIVRIVFKKFKDSDPLSYKDVWSDTNLFHIWSIWLICFLIIFYTNLFIQENV